MRKRFCLLLVLLAVAGFIAPVNAAPPVCSSTTEGTIVYNVDYKVMQYCDGTNWISMRGSAVTTFDSLSCGDGEIIEWDSATSLWTCDTLDASVRDGVTWSEISGVPAGFSDGTDDVGLTAETDPKIGATTSGQWCRGTGSGITCDQAAPSNGVVQGGFCGYVYMRCQSDREYYTRRVPCNGTQITAVCNSTASLYGNGGSYGCPSGYMEVEFNSNSTSPSVRYYWYSCVKT